MPTALANGIDYATFWHLTPKTLWKIIEEKQKIADVNAWNLGQYFMHSIGACFSKGSHYPKKPFSQEIYGIGEEENANGEMSEEKRKQVELFFAQLDVLGRNAQLAKEREAIRKEQLETGKETEKEESQIDMDNFEPYDLGEG